MARTRSINPAAPADEDVATLSLAARYLWAFLPCHADDTGFLFEDADELKRRILPRDGVDIGVLLGELAAKGHLRRYLDDAGRSCIQFSEWAHSPSGRAYGPSWPAARSLAIRRDGGRCVNCRDTDRLEVHHVRPLRLFGDDFGAAHALANLATLCKPCHRRADAAIQQRERGL